MRTPTLSKKPPFKKHPLTIALQACAYTILGGSPLAVAAPTGGAVVGGSGTISQSGTATTINQATQNLAINWQSFDVAANERVQFIQPNASAIALNRILSNNGTTIAGRIDSNGKVILVNANGIFFTSTSVLNVGSIIASGLDINPAAFMNGNYVFNELPGSSGAVINNGMINASLGGNVALIGRRVENNGLIVANLGTVSLAAGKQAVLTFDSGGLLGVRVSQEILQNELGVDPAVLNSGEIQAQGGRVLLTASQSQDVFSRAVNNAGMEPATSVVVNDDGTFTLGGADVLNSGSINTSSTSAGQSGGRIVLIGENVTSSGTLKADAASGNGGEIELHANNMTLLTGNSITSARSESNGNGGIVKVLGDKVGLFDQSTVDVSGAHGGGQALIGGDFQGKNTNIRNATRTYVGKDTAIYADALQQGNGGKIINWGNSYTWFYGNAFARGGSTSGNGGLVEISGKGLTFDGRVDTSSANGTAGTVLFDPMDIIIHNGSGQLQDTQLGDSSILAGDGVAGSTFNISEDRLETLGATANIRLEATNNITINDLTGDGILNLSTNASGSFTIQAGGSFSMLDTSNSIRTQGGAVSITAAAINMGSVDTSRRASFAGGAITLNATAGNLSAASLNSNGGTANTSSSNGNNAGIIGVTASGQVTINGAISANGSNGGGSGDNDGGNATTVTLTGSGIDLRGNVSATGGAGDGSGNDGNGANITFTGPVTLGGPVTVNADGRTRGDISFSSTLNGTPTLGLTGRDVTFSGAVGNTNPLGALMIDATRAVNAGAMTANSLNVAQSTSFTSGAINTSSATAAGGVVDITSSGAVSTGGITSSGLSNGGAVTVATSGSFTSGAIDTSSTTGQGGDVGITSTGAVNVASVNSRSTRAFADMVVANGGAVAISGGTVNVGIINSSTTASGGSGGTVSIDAATAITLNGDIDASGDAAVVGASRTANLGLTSAGSVTVNHTADFTSPIDISGSGGTLNSADRVNNWIITGNDVGLLNAGITFSNFGTLNGNTLADTFTFNNNSSFTGIVNGGTGAAGVIDHVNLAALTTVDVTLGAAGPYRNIEQFTGNNTTSTLRGETANTWDINGQNDGMVNGITFINFNNLVGGSGLDTFTFAPAGNLANIDGGTGTNTLTVTGNGSPLTLGNGSFSAGSSAASYSNIANVAANNVGDTTLAGISVNTLAVNSIGNITDSAAFNVTNLTLNTTGAITLTNQPSITGGTFTANAISLTTGNISGGNLIANSVTLNTTSGISTVNTTTGLLNVTNGSGNVTINNTGSVSASVVTQVGSTINFTNTSGDVTVRRLSTNGSALDTLGASGEITLNVNNGAVYGNPNTIYRDIPDVVTGAFRSRVVGGDIGTDPRYGGRPLSLMVPAIVDLTVLSHRAFIYNFGRPTVTITGTLVDFSDSRGLNQSLLEVDSLDEFDPAIFTEIRNYYYEDVAIMMPADQRLDGTDEEEKEKEEKL